MKYSKTFFLPGMSVALLASSVLVGCESNHDAGWHRGYNSWNRQDYRRHHVPPRYWHREERWEHRQYYPAPAPVPKIISPYDAGRHPGYGSGGNSYNGTIGGTNGGKSYNGDIQPALPHDAGSSGGQSYN